ncbi:DNA polymerase III subunit chi [Rosenbergiella australiborealis]|uniref:DNA polymerase III subunit chi n=1 Tax=Rosenbergiella australiborealis TaxID=1544696 RepID=A0ABS5T160_9GAMM|nr:DNA polymerase III subunit chi [Rosenbergiella australiborealis]MBT0725907.1 DNA polymerase III subunit chi [Rosenbergiella australiborealis]
MKNATFYLLPADPENQPLTAAEIEACELAAKFWRDGKRILIACNDEAQALRMDEALWQRPVEAFVPHNLAGEGPRQGAPVELAWPQKRGSSAREVLISLLPYFADFATGFYEVVDFVPEENTLKQLARDRYKAYRSAGFQLNTVTAASA